MPASAEPNKKSVYIALAGVIAISLADLAANNSIVATQLITIPLLTFAAGRQIVKMATGK